MPQAFTEHDLEHQRLRVQVHVLQQLVLKLYVVQATRMGDPDEPETSRILARKLVERAVAGIREFPGAPGLTEVEQAMLMDDSDDVFTDIDQHLEFMLAGTL